MTQQTTSLSPDEWKALCLTNVAQLHTFLNGIPPISEGGLSGITDQHMALIEGHLNRQSAFLNAWRRSKAVGTVAQAESQPEAPAPAQTANGAQAPKRKGGWPRGKSRKAKQPEATQ